MLRLSNKKTFILLSYIKLLFFGGVAVVVSLGIPLICALWFNIASDEIDMVFAVLGIALLAYGAANYWKDVDKYRSM